LALSGSSLSDTLFLLRQSKGNVGENLKDLTDTIGKGTVNSVVGKPFLTIDTGSGVAPGTGTGAGLLLIPGNISSILLLASIASFGGMGEDLPGFCDDVENSVILEMSKATLSSLHPAVYLGVGSIVPGSIPVTSVEITSQILIEGLSANLLGLLFPSFASALGTGIAAGFLTAGGQVTISGSPPPVPTPGAGAGTGVIS